MQTVSGDARSRIDEVKLLCLINVCAASVNSYAHVPLLVSRLLFSMSITHSDASYS